MNKTKQKQAASQKMPQSEFKYPANQKKTGHHTLNALQMLLKAKAKLLESRVGSVRNVAGNGVGEATSP